MPLNYEYHTEPRNHQREFLERTCELPFHALFWEMGSGKTKVMIDNISYLYLEGKIDGALIVAPNGVDLNWLVDEIPKHCRPDILKQSRIFRFSSKKSGTKKHKEQAKWNLEHVGLAWLIMSYDAFMTDAGKETALKFLDKRQVFYLLDESAAIKTPGAKRTMRITRTAYRAKYRRILDGYPTPKGAFDLYSQIKFLDEDFWKRYSWDSPTMFRNYFGVFESRHNYGTGTDYELLLGYRNLEELNTIIKPISSRVLKQDVLDLPPKIYQPRYFELSKEQREFYDQLAEEYKIWLDKETLVTANLAMVRMLRLQQISCGYIPIGEDEPVHVIPGKNTRLALLEELIETTSENPEKTIIWATYNLDIKLITELLTKHNRRFVTFTGATSDDDRIAAKKAFQEGHAEYIVATQGAMHRGHTLHAAKRVIYYSNNFNLVHRKQSEDRAHRDGLLHPVVYIDLLGVNTIDRSIMLNLCGKMDTGDVILGDSEGHDVRSQMRSWLESV